MSNIVISGYYGFGNAGDEAMLCAIIDAIRKEEADAHITVISGNPKETSKKHNINAVGTFSAFGILKAIANSDLVISGGGSLLQDATSIRNTYYYLSMLYWQCNQRIYLLGLIFLKGILLNFQNQLNNLRR